MSPRLRRWCPARPASDRRQDRRSPTCNWIRNRGPGSSVSSDRESGRRIPTAPGSPFAQGHRRSRRPPRDPDDCDTSADHFALRYSQPRVESTPGCWRIRSSIPQKHPPASIAFRESAISFPLAKRCVSTWIVPNVTCRFPSMDGAQSSARRPRAADKDKDPTVRTAVVPSPAEPTPIAGNLTTGYVGMWSC